MIYKANDKYNAVLTQGFTVGDTILYVNTVPTNVPTMVVLAKGTDDEAVFAVTGKTSSTLTGVSLLKGSIVNHLSGTDVVCLNNEEFLNQYATAVTSSDALKPIVYGADGGTTDDYAISLTPTPVSLTAIIGVPITFKANTANTGACTLNINTLGAIAIKKNFNVDLATGDILAGQLITVAYDGTSFQRIGGGGGSKATVSEILNGTDDTKFVTSKGLADAGISKIVAEPISDHNATGQKVSLTAAANMAFGDVGYIASTGKVALIDADAIATMGGIVMCVDATINADASGIFLLIGIVRDDTWNWTVGGYIYGTVTGTTGNTLSQTAPTGTDDVVQILGIATHADRMIFNPQLIQIERV